MSKSVTDSADHDIHAPAEDRSIHTKASEARDKLNAVLADLRVKAQQTEQAIRKNLVHAEQSVREGVAHTETRIKENPFAAVGIAAGIGFVIGLLVNRNR